MKNIRPYQLPITSVRKMRAHATPHISQISVAVQSVGSVIFTVRGTAEVHPEFIILPLIQNILICAILKS